MISHIFITCENMNSNNQSCNCGNLVHVYGVSQCHIIMESIICKGSVSLLVSLLNFSLVFITLHDKHHFFEICNSVKMLKNYTHTKVHSSCNFFFFVIWGISRMIAVIVVICITVDRCSHHVNFSVWICSCYIYVYKIEWCHLY